MPNESPNEERVLSEVSSSEVPINHFMDAINESDSDFEDNTSDDSNDRNYELLATQDIADSEQQTTYYAHNYSVEWVDWDQYDDNHTNEATDCPPNETTDGSDPTLESQTEEATNCDTNECSIESQICLSDDRINEIKTLMSGFELPNNNIPVWAQNLPEEQWKAFLLRKLDDK